MFDYVSSTFDRMVNPFNLVSVTFSNVLFFLQAYLLIVQFYWHWNIWKSVLAIQVFFVIFFLGICLFLLEFCIFIVSFLTVPYISCQFVFGFASLFISAISAMHFFIVS